MRIIQIFLYQSVKILALFTVIIVAGCSTLFSRYHESCKTRAYLKTNLPDYISQRYDKSAPVRMAIIPFSAPANLAVRDNELPGIGNEIAWRLKDEFLLSENIPIVEIFNRQDWPGKKAEFNTGNFGALQQARAAGYDLVLVGSFKNLTSLDDLSARVKIIEVETGITIWNGLFQASTARNRHERMSAGWGLTERKPSNIYSDLLIDELASCIHTGITGDEVLPG